MTAKNIVKVRRMVTRKSIEEAIDRAVWRERRKCAELADQVVLHGPVAFQGCARALAEAIRGRK